jgi:DNA-binding NarL/FixJ family response regulator
MMTSVLIIDDHPIVLQGCRRVLEDAGMEPVLTASDLVAGYRLYRRHQPDVIVIDLAIRGKGLGGLDLIRRIRTHNPRACILVLSMHNDAMIVAHSLEAGATGYVLKDTSSEQLVKAVQQIASGVPYLDNELAVKVALAGSRVVRRNPLSDLTPRELQVLALLADGKTYDRIADELHVSYKTVVNVSSQLKRKLKASNLPELVSTAVKLLAAPS